LSAMGAPTFYDKLLPVPIMNLLVRQINSLTSSDPLARIGGALSPRRRNVVYTALWTAVFIALSATQGVGDKHPGQYYPFWQKACDAGNERACDYSANLLVVYCNTGSGWACNEVGVRRLQLRQLALPDFRRGCELGFAPACTNMNRQPNVPPVRELPPIAELPIVLRGTKPILRERNPATLRRIACQQGWVGLCNQNQNKEL
jgi:hypothetical protein